HLSTDDGGGVARHTVDLCSEAIGRGDGLDVELRRRGGCVGSLFDRHELTCVLPTGAFTVLLDRLRDDRGDACLCLGNGHIGLVGCFGTARGLRRRRCRTGWHRLACPVPCPIPDPDTGRAGDL